MKIAIIRALIGILFIEFLFCFILNLKSTQIGLIDSSLIYETAVGAELSESVLKETLKIAKSDNSVPVGDSSPPVKGISKWLPSDPNETRKALLAAVLTVIATLIVVFFKKIFYVLGKAFSWAWSRVKVEKAVESRYRKRVAKNLRSIQILDMSEAKDLESFYVPLKLAKWITPSLKENQEDSHSDVFKLIDALEKYERITILGAPGAGKTTITSYNAAAIANRTLRIKNRIYFPIYIQLRRLKEFLESDKYKDKSLKDLAAEPLSLYDFPNPLKFLSRELNAGNCLIVLDGFDELSDNEGLLQRKLANKVTDFVNSISTQNRIVLTSRSAGYEPAWFPNFRVLEMTDLSLPHVKQFIEGWYGKDRKVYVNSLHKILDDNYRLQLLVANPLMLAIVCFVYGSKIPEDNFLPQKRVDLYERCIEALIVEWDKSRNIDRKPKFSYRHIKTVLQYVAYEALGMEKIDFSKKELLSLIRTHLPNANLPQYQDEEFLNEVLEHTGLFKEKASDTIGLIHLTFQEYLSAQIIAKQVLNGIRNRDVKAELGDVLSNLSNPKWTEPIMLASGILRGRTEFISILYEEYEKKPNSQFELLLAGCLRDTDLENYEFDNDYLLKQDKILSRLVENAAKG